jgi:hypothetical protein
MILLTILILWIVPILLFGICAWFNMEPGESVDEFISRKDLEVDFVFIWIPGANIIPLIRILFKWIFNYVLSIRKP